MDVKFHLDVYTVVQDIHNESIKQSINKHLLSACYNINISFLLWKAWNYLCIRSRHHILGIVYLNCSWHTENKQNIVGEYPLCLQILEQTAHSEATLSSSKRDDKTISTQYSLHNWCKQMNAAVGSEAHRGWVTNTTTRFYYTLTSSCHVY